MQFAEAGVTTAMTTAATPRIARNLEALRMINLSSPGSVVRRCVVHRRGHDNEVTLTRHEREVDVGRALAARVNLEAVRRLDVALDVRGAGEADVVHERLGGRRGLVIVVREEVRARLRDANLRGVQRVADGRIVRADDDVRRG